MRPYLRSLLALGLVLCSAVGSFAQDQSFNGLPPVMVMLSLSQLSTAIPHFFSQTSPLQTPFLITSTSSFSIRVERFV